MTPARRAALPARGPARRLVRLVRPDSLRGRLMLAMLGVFVFGAAAASALDGLNLAVLLSPVLSGRRLGGLGLLLREPYQDITVLVAFSLAMLLLIWLVSGWSLAPLRRASQEAAAVGPGQQARISDEDMPSEIRPLILAFNGALARLAAAYALEQRFTADAAHELRTPLAALDLRLQRARAEGQARGRPAVRSRAQGAGGAGRGIAGAGRGQPVARGPRGGGHGEPAGRGGGARARRRPAAAPGGCSPRSARPARDRGTSWTHRPGPAPAPGPSARAT